MSGGHPLIPTSESDQPFLIGGCLPLEKALAVDVHLFFVLAHTPGGRHASLSTSYGRDLTAPFPGGLPPSPRSGVCQWPGPLLFCESNWAF